MITKITGQLAALHDDTLILKIDAFEYEVLIPEFTRRQLQSELNQTVSLHTIEYLEGNPMQGRMTPRLIGFLSEVEREFFELVCSVDGVGVKKALRRDGAAGEGSGDQQCVVLFLYWLQFTSEYSRPI